MSAIVRAFALIFGLILLFPGACSLVFFLVSIRDHQFRTQWLPLWFITWVVSLGGLAIVIWVGRRSPELGPFDERRR